MLSAYRLREHVDHLAELSFTARIGTLLVGSVRLSPVWIGETPGLLLGPLDRFLFGQWLAASSQPIDLVGASIGAWRQNCWGSRPRVCICRCSSRC